MDKIETGDYTILLSSRAMKDFDRLFKEMVLYGTITFKSSHVDIDAIKRQRRKAIIKEFYATTTKEKPVYNKALSEVKQPWKLRR